MGACMVAAILTCLVGISYGDVAVTKPGEYMVCKPVAGVFGTSGGGKNSTQKGVMPVLQGPMGPPGPPGKTGLQGPAGEPDYKMVEKLINTHLQPLRSRMYAVQKHIDIIKAGGVATSGRSTPALTEEDKKNAKACEDTFQSPVNVGRVCYDVVGGDGLLWSHATADGDCKKRGGRLADLDSRQIYDKLYDYIDGEYDSVIQAWTGLRYEGDNLLLYGGKPASYAKWSSGYPRKSTISYYRSYTKVYIYIDSSSYVRKLYNGRSSLKKPYAICSFNLKNSTDSTTASP